MKSKLTLMIVLTILGLTTACSDAPEITSPELTALVERAAIGDLFKNYYSQFGPNGKHDFIPFFTSNGILEVNGLKNSGVSISFLFTLVFIYS